MSEETFSDRLNWTAAKAAAHGMTLSVQFPLPDDFRLVKSDYPESIAPRYSHRNGETEPPTVEGIYFIQHPQPWHRKDSGMVSVEYDMDEDGFGAEWIVWAFGQDYYSLMEQLDVNMKWWGPVTLPWESAQIPQDKVKWSKKFRRDLAQWSPCISGRLRNAIGRVAASFEMLEDARMDRERREEIWRYVSQDAILVFGNDGTLLDFNEWIRILREEPERLLYVRDVGKKGAKQLLDAIDNYVEHAA